jgi:RHS repeat-associated protein
MLISEFRLSGPNGSTDEFIELYNNTDSNLTIITADGSAGWALVSSDGVVRFTIPNGTIIPAHGHYLGVNGGGYSLNDYGGVGKAVGDTSFPGDIPDDAGIAIFKTADPANFTLANRLDAAGFSSVANVLYREGTGLSPGTVVPAPSQFSFVRKVASINSLPVDTDDNGNDFALVAVDGSSIPGAILGAPGPENLFSPLQRNNTLNAALIDPTSPRLAVPNFVRVGSGNGGTLSIRRSFTNNTGETVSQLRLRIIDITTLNTPIAAPPQADLRLADSLDENVPTMFGIVTVKGTTLEQIPIQSLGGGLNSSMTVALPNGGLANGDTVSLQFLMNVIQSGRFRFYISVEALTGTDNQNPTPSITDFNPRNGTVGTDVTIVGTSLKANTGNTTVTFTGAGGSRINALVRSASLAEVQTTVPNGAVTGPIEVVNVLGRAMTNGSFTVDPQQSFQLTVAPSSATAIQRGTATYVISVTSPQSTFTQLARLSTLNLPAGARATFEPAQITAGATSTLSVSLNDVDLSPNSYSFTIRAAADIEGLEMVQTASATLMVQPAGETTLTGRVLSTEKEPIMGATASLDGRTATTDAAGVFLLSGVTAGANRPLMIDGRTASSPNRTYPVINEPATVIANQANVVPFTFFLPPIDIQADVPVIPNQNTVATNERVPGLSMTIPAGVTLRNRDNTPVTRVSITPLAIDRTPAPLPSNVATNMVYTSQPGGAVANGPMPVIYPNMGGASPGTVIDLYAFNHDTVQWYVYGQGKVSPDGRTITPNPGVGLRDFSWHFPNIGPDGNPGGPNFPNGPDGPGPSPNPSPTPCVQCPCNITPDPVDLSTGMKIELTNDIAIGGARGGLELTRTYTTDLAQSCDACPFGRGTTHNYAVHLSGTFQAGGAGRVVMPSQVTGRLFSYAGTDTTGALLFSTTATTNQLGDVVRKLTNGTFEYLYKSGSVMRFDSSGRLSAIVDVNGNTTTLSYTGSNLTRITDAVGRSITLDYNGSSIIRATDPLGRVWQYSYEGGPLTSVTDPLSNVTRYSYIIGGRLASVTDPRGNLVKQLTYDSNGRVSEQKFANGGITRYAYTLSGQIVTSATVTDALGRVTTKRFNPDGYVIAETDALGQSSRYDRDILTNLNISTSGPCGCAEVTRQFDARGNVLAVTDRLNQTSRYEYDPQFNRVTRQTDPLGHSTTYTYDSHGNVLSMTDPLNQNWTYTYDSFGELTGMTDPLGHTRFMEYDAQGNLTAVKDALGNRSTFEYDAVGRLTAVVDPLGRRATFIYDARDRVTALTDTAGATTTLDYDPNGNLTGFVNALNKRWISAYDSKNRLILTTDPLGRLMRWVYDREDQLIARVSPSGRTTRYAYDPRGLTESVTTPLGFVTRYAYDNARNLTTLTDARGNVTTFIYDELYRLTTQRDPLGQLTRYNYDAASNLTQRADRLGRLTHYTYDALNRPAQIQYVDATVNYQYDPAYRLTRIDDTQSGSIEWAYDAADRLLSETTPQGVVAYAYNAAGQRASMKAADRPFVNYTYDTAGRLATIAQGNETFTYAYDTLSRVASLQRPNGVRTTYAYDNVNRLARLAHTNSANQALEDFQYAYNADDEIESIASLASPQLLPNAKTATPADPANRITQFGTASYTHDNEGQTTTRTDIPTTSNYTWDARGRLTHATPSNGQIIDYAYDTYGRRISRTANGTTTSFLYDQEDIVLDQDASGATVDYLNGLSIDDKLLQKTQTTGSLYFLQDHLGSTSALTNSGGTIVERISYEGFGASSGSTLTRFNYTGREYDVVSELLYCRARWYDAKQGRFISEDPIGLDGGTNFYAYVGSNPLSYVDPLGLSLSSFGRGFGSGLVSGLVTSLIVGAGLGLAAAASVPAAVALGLGLAAYGGYQLGGAIGQLFDPALCPDQRDELLGGLLGGALGGLAGGRVGGAAGYRAGTAASGIGRGNARPFGIPEDYIQSPAKKGSGVQYTDPNNNHNYVRVMSGNPNSSNPAQQNPYVKDMRSGRALDSNGNVVHQDSPEAHIPVNNYRYRRNH